MAENLTTVLKTAYVSQKLRWYAQSTRGIATPEVRREFEHEADQVLAAHDRAVEKRGATAALLCERDESWEHHDQTDDFPCARCLARADQIEGEKA